MKFRLPQAQKFEILYPQETFSVKTASIKANAEEKRLPVSGYGGR